MFPFTPIGFGWYAQLVFFFESWFERNITYDRSGNLLTLDRYDSSSGTTPSESLSYSYSGPKRSTWTYDSHANVTTDPQGGVSIAWNTLDLPRMITSGTGTSSVSTQRGYLSDGSLAQVSDGTTTRLYLGDIVFNKTSNGTVTLESAGWEGGRLLPGSGSDKVLYTVTDHLGSVRLSRTAPESSAKDLIITRMEPSRTSGQTAARLTVPKSATALAARKLQALR